MDGVLTDVALTVTVPLATALRRPDELIVASPVPFVTLHVTDLSAAFAGKTKADICSVPWKVEMVVADPAPDTTMDSTNTSWLDSVITNVPLMDGVLTDVALTVTVPLATALRRPDELIVASPVPFVTLHVTDLSAAFAGKTKADICSVPWKVEMVVADPAPDTTMDSTNTSWLDSVITNVPLMDGVLTDVALTVTVPLATALRRPDELIVASPVPFVTLHVTDLSAAFAGKTKADICSVPWKVEMVVADPAPDTTMDSTNTSWLDSVITNVPLMDGVLTDVALTVTVPLAEAVNNPAELMVASPVPFVTLQTIALSAAFAGKTFADICSVPFNVLMTPEFPALETVIESTITT
jgi:hypothetical protein